MTLRIKFIIGLADCSGFMIRERSITMTSVSSVAVTVAERGASSIIDISPKISPTPRWAMIMPLPSRGNEMSTAPFSMK